MPSTATVPRLRGALRGSAPTLEAERAAWAEGAEIVVGLDEVGRGAWAGPVTVGAVVAPRDRRITKVRDSKALTRAEREALAPRIAQWATASAVGHASAQECDELGMTAALALAARRAIAALAIEPDVVLLDGNVDVLGDGRTRCIVKGDARCLSIAAASIIAKVDRDALMRAEAQHHPAYAFDRSVGYPCPRHRMALTAYGPTPIHRMSWSFVDDLPWSGITRYRRPDPQLALFP